MLSYLEGFCNVFVSFFRYIFSSKEVKNTKKAAVDKAHKVKVVKDEKKADKEEPTKEEKKTLKVENHNLAQPISKKA